jgi:hypothetical protein
MSGLDYRSLFMAFSFAGAGGVSVHLGTVLDYFPGVEEWVGEPCMVCDHHLHLLQFHACRFRASCRGEMVLFVIGRLSTG